MGTESTDRPDSKVARVIEEHELDGWGDRLEAEWLGVDGERTSLRDLADQFNRAVLEATLRDADVVAIEYDVESTYRVLTDDDVPRADVLRKERELEREGVDVEELRSNFVTHQAVHSYLRDYREAELEDRSVDPERKVETLQRLEGRTAAVAQSTLDGLVRSGEVTDREYELFVEVRAVCEECGRDYALVDLVRDGGCDCGGE
ncbi:Uncharacterized protein AArcCO_2412 [Halalkaliarchaeum sp. AArc-CO]|uniref:rod-determining factor RdfA n=1 Tax=unclassified Halalkaliarchaeum TaxID=2678344 RepID=UPI00217D3D3A|nr:MULTISPECIES: rod-determining factor RdfA [unclassified Halalkaliarchaeum]MDR5672197.1 hypothetical protein [Halalkaliarchaeum sp. AArc-GB]UWG51703.1 Uncharacterized protein AArcCO_2412 [Halalkaliarchaeum sp. AArc-CO]